MAVPQTYNEWEKENQVRETLTQAGMQRALSESELMRLHQARDGCAAYLDSVFNPPAPAPQDNLPWWKRR